MVATTEAVLLRIFVGENDRVYGRVMYEELVEVACALGMAGATALPGPVGFGLSRHVRSELNVDAPPQLPVVVEIVDTEVKVRQFLAAVDGMIETGLVTMEKVKARFYGRRPLADG
jgi:PII-like signaling protein